MQWTQRRVLIRGLHSIELEIIKKKGQNVGGKRHPGIYCPLKKQEMTSSIFMKSMPLESRM